MASYAKIKEPPNSPFSRPSGDRDQPGSDEDFALLSEYEGPLSATDEQDEDISLIARPLDPESTQRGDGGGGTTEEMARQHRQAEHELTPLQAIRIYPMAVFWCLVASACVIMEGYDTILIGNFFAYPTFATKYGQFVDESGQHQLSAVWQAVLGNSSGVGCFFGVLINGHLVERYGQKKVLLGALASLSCTIFLTFFAPNILVLMLGELLCGLPWGVFASSAPAYASEVLPMCLRVYLTSYTNMCFIIGQLIAAAVLACLVHRTDEWSYRIPFAIQWLWPALIMPVLLFAPESPWHLVRTRRLDQAENALRRLQRQGAGLDARASLAHIVHTDRLEKKMLTGTSYWDCFRGVELRRTEIACMAFAGQVLAGSPFAYNSTYFFQQVGLTTNQTYLMNTGGTVMSLAGTLVNWFTLMPRYGHRQIYLWGMATMPSILVVVGVLNLWHDSSKAIGTIQALLTLAWTFVFQLSIGQLGWAIPAEVSSTRLRQKTVCLARNAYYLTNITANFVNPYFINPGQLNLRGYTGFIWAASGCLTFTWAYFRLPETKGRTYEELDWLFAKRTPTRAFATARVDDLPAQSNSLYDHGDVLADIDEDAQEMAPVFALEEPEEQSDDDMESDRLVIR